MAARDYTTLPNLELTRVDYGKRVITFFDNRPLLFTTAYAFAKITRVLNWKFYHYVLLGTSATWM